MKFKFLFFTLYLDYKTRGTIFLLIRVNTSPILMMNSILKQAAHSRAKNAFKFSVVLAFLLTAFSSINGLHAQATYTSTGITNNWSQTTTWSMSGPPDGDGNGLPDNNDNVIIANTHTVNVNLGSACSALTLNGSGILNYSANVALAVGSNLTMNGTSQITGNNAAQSLSVAAPNTFNVLGTATNARISGITFTVNGVSSIAGTFTLNNNTGIKTFVGAVTNSGSWTSTAVTTTANLVFRNGISSSGSTFVAGGATFNTTAGQSVGGTGDISFANAVSINVNTSLAGSGSISFASTVTIATGVTLTNNNTDVVTMSNTGAGVLTGAGTGTFTQGTTGNTLSYAGSTITVPTFNATGANNTVIYTANAPTIRAVNYYNLTHSGTGTVTVGTISIAGDLTESSTGTFNFTGTTTFNGSATQTISGTGTFSFVNLTLNTTGASNLLVNRDITITGVLNFAAANGLVVVNSTSNITLGNAATITNANPSRYIQLDGSTSAGSQLIKTSTNNVNSWQILFPIGTSSGGYTPVDLSFSTMNNAPTAGNTLAVKAIYNNSIQGQLRRTFRLISNAAGTTFSNGRFYINSSTDVSGGDALANYTAYWYLNNGISGNGAWTTLTGSINNSVGVNFPTNPPGYYFITTAAAQALSTGTYYYTMGSSTAYPNTWYSYQTGVWSNWQNWTLDPSGTTLVNGLNLPPQPGDAIVILNGIIITNDISGQVTSSATINSGGTLNMAATTGNTLGTVSGAGLLRIQGINLPTGTYTGFVAAGTGGTVEYYNTGGTLPAGQTIYNKLLLSNTTGAAISFTTVNNLVVNSDFNITQTGGAGTVGWQINNATATARAISILGDFTVSSGGRITVGTGAPGSQHSLSLMGNFTNNGIVQFFDGTDGAFSGANYTSGAIWTTALKGNAVNVTFSGLPDRTITCNGQTDFYRLIVDKGINQQSVLTLNSSNVSNFRLFGPNNIDNDMVTETFAAVSNESLSLENGTLQLTGNINIPNLIVDTNASPDYSGGWPIPQTAALWVNGAGVTIQVTTTSDTGDNGRQIYVYGLLRLTSGTINMGHSRGLLGGGSGVFLIEGGTLNTKQFRTTYLGTANRFSYTQTNGIVNVGTTGIPGIDVNTYPRFALPYPECTFIMSGGTLNVAAPMASGTSNNGGILINAAPSNISVTNGTVNVLTPASTTNFTINSTAPFYNLNITKAGAGAGVANLAALDFNDGAGAVTIPVQPLVVTNLTLSTTGSPTLNCLGNNLTIAGNLDVQSGSTLTPGANTITFSGSGAQAWTHSGTITSLNNVVLNKSAGTLTLGGTQAFPNITGGTVGLTLTQGTLNDGDKAISVTGALINNATHVSPSALGSIILNGATSIGGSGTFGNLTISTNNSVATTGDHTVNGTLRLVGANTTLNIQSNSLSALGNIYDAAAGTTSVFTATKRIRTAGLRNDGGLTRQGIAGDLLFPVGTTGGTAYTPATINVTATTYGKITMRPVIGVHPNLTPGQSLQYYWRVTSTGYAGISGSVAHKSYTYGAATIQGTLTSYKPSRYDPATFTWSTGTNYNATGLTVIPNFSAFGTNIDGEYTTGNITAGPVGVFYSRQSGNWNVNTTWSSTPCGGTCGAAVPAGAVAGVNFPGPNNPVVIGNASNFHTVTMDADGRSCGSLYVETGSTIDCSTRINLSFGVNTSQAVGGKGTIRIAAVTAGIGVFPGGDFTNFIGPNGGTVEWYGNAKTLPTTGPAPSSLVLDNFYNLIINPSAGQTITLPPSNLTVYNIFTKSGSGIAATNTAAAGTRSFILNHFTISGGNFNVLTNGANTALLSFTLTGDLTIASGASLAASGGTATHAMTTSGNIINNGTLDFRNGSFVNLTFTGASNTSFSGPSATTTRLNFLTLNKGVDQTSTLTIDVLGTSMNTLTNNWLTLTTGTVNFNNSASYTLVSNTNTDYTIPAMARLKVQSGTVDIIGDLNDDDNDLLLAGTLEVTGGNVNINAVGNNRNRNNDIEYASAGIPKIIVSSGSLYVNGAIRRSTSTLSGALDYDQSGGTVTVGGRNCDANDTRGVFEIENNTGSRFAQSGGILNVRRSTSGLSFADLYINPATASASGGTIQFGMDVNTAVTTPLSINIVPSVANVSILNAGTAQVVDMRSSELTVSGSLTVNTNSTLQTNTLDVNIGGNLNITGIYNGTILTGNTTTFNGSGPQTGSLTAGSTFQNITINKSSGTATLNGNSSINNLNILSGTLSVTNTLDINGDIINNSIQTGAGTLNIAGANATHTITSANGTFGNLNLGGPAAAKTVNVAGNMTITGTLNFTAFGTSRYLNIGSNKLTFSQAAANILNAGATRFIKTNGVSSDLGVVKDWAAGLRTFVYTIGTRTNYTPASFTLTVTSPGTFTVIPVDDQHPTASAVGQQILNYYWIVTRGSGLAYNAGGSHSYQFPTGFIGGSGGTLIAAHLDAIKLVGWTPSPGNGGSFTSSPPNTTMVFTNSLNTNLPGPGGASPEVEFHYTAGTNTTLPNPVTPVYSRFFNNDGSNPTNVSNLGVGGDWDLATNWTLESDGTGLALSSVPTGRPVVILSGGRINLNVPGLRAFSTQINGLLVMVNSTGHNLGSLSGIGTLRASTSTLPAGNFTTFVSSAGGTIEYLPSPATDINMNSRTDYNHLRIAGTNIVTMTNVNLNLNGNLTVVAGATLNNTTNNRDMAIVGNISNAGIFSQGTGTINLTGNMANTGTYNQSSGITNIAGNWSNTATHNVGTSTVNFTGSGAQGISGTNTFYNLGISKSAGNVTLNALTTVSNLLTLTTGNIITTAANPLVLTTAASSTVGNASSFVSGPMRKTFNGAFTFPVGSNTVSRYRPATVSATSASDTWTVEYIGNNPTLQGYPNASFSASLGKVSQFEYWNVSRLGATTAALELTYNVGSYVVNPTHIGNMANLKVVRWDRSSGK